MSDTNHSPVSLAAGSYDYDTLKTGLGVASRGSAADYQQNVAKALNEASTVVHEAQDARTIPGYAFVDVTVPELGVVERRQVFVPADASVDHPVVDAPPQEPVTEPVKPTDDTSTDQPDEAALTTTQARRRASTAATTTEKE
jgi:hypothetical protein